MIEEAVFALYTPNKIVSENFVLAFGFRPHTYSEKASPFVGF